MSLTVLSVAYPLAPVGPDAVGGSEQVLYRLDQALVRAGHRSIVVACESSQTAGTLVPVPAPPERIDYAVQHAAFERHRAAVAAALERWPVDIVHVHGILFHNFLPPPGVPALVTLHGPWSWYPEEALRPSRPDTWLHCVSATQHRTAPPGVRLLRPIENGVPVEALAARHAKRRFALILGRVCAEKGVHHALEAARRADVPLLIAGEVHGYEDHEYYFEQEVKPRLDDKRRFIGPLDFTRKRRFLTAARCLLVASVAHETSSLVAREALACGTPVVAFANGALPEAIEHGRTGFLVRDEAEMAEAIQAAAALDPEACRQVARERFSLERMVARYFDLYERLARGERPRAARPGNPRFPMARPPVGSAGEPAHRR